jgi:hypothetical protein
MTRAGDRATHLARAEVQRENILHMEKLEQYQSELGEKAIKIVLERWYALTLKKVSEVKDTRTPDYEVLNSAGEVIAICEVKSCVDANVPTYNSETSYEELAAISKKRDRNHRSKLERHHGKAMSQLVNHQGLPTLVVFVSFDMTDGMDMAMFLQDYEELYSSVEMADLYLLIRIHQDIIPSDTFSVKYTAQLMHTTKAGEDFGHQYLSLGEAWKNGGILPATFSVKE